MAREAALFQMVEDGLLPQADANALSLDGGKTLQDVMSGETADANVIGGNVVFHRFLLASGADADVDLTLTNKTRVFDVVVVNKGAGTVGSIVTVKNVTTAITDAIDMSGADNIIGRPTTIDDAQHEVAAAANLRVSYASTGADFPGAEVVVLGYRVA